MTPERRKLMFRLVVLGVVALLGLLTLEVGIRATGFYQSWTERNGGDYASPWAWQLREPWVHRRPPHTQSSYRQPEFEFPLECNALGLRDVDHPLEKPAGEVRVVGLGDSFTEGQGAAFADTWLQVCGRSLAEASGRTVRPIVGGVAGSDPVLERQLLARHLLPLQPDLVLVAVNPSDVTDVLSRGGVDRFGPDGFLRRRPRPGVEGLYRRSHLARFLCRGILKYDAFLLAPSVRQERQQVALQELEQALLGFQELPIPTAVVIHPTAAQIHAPYHPDTAQLAALARRLRRAGLPVIELQDEFDAAIPPGERDDYFWPLDGHCTAKGYQLFGEAVARAVVRAGLAGLERRP